MDNKPERSSGEPNQPLETPVSGRINAARRVMSRLTASFVDTFGGDKRFKTEEVTGQNLAQKIELVTRLHPKTAFKYASVYAEFGHQARPDPKVLEQIRIYTRRLVSVGVLNTLDFEGENGEIVPFFQTIDENLLHQLAEGKISLEDLEQKIDKK